LSLIDRTYRLQYGVDGLGLECTADGVSLAGVPLLRATPAGLAPRPMEDLGVLLKGAYGRPVDPVGVSPGLRVVAAALNEGDLGRAMVAALHLKLPALSREGAGRLAKAHGALAKFDPDQPRDELGRWTADGGGSGDAQRIPVANGPWPPQAANDNFSPAPPRPPKTPNTPEELCILASKQCQVEALNDKSSRTKYFNACIKAEDTCLLALEASRLTPRRDIFMIFPDHTVLHIKNGDASVFYISGARLGSKLP
jgi:hypothetical protein